MIHLNIRSAKKYFEKLKDFLSHTGSFFKVLCLTETWFGGWRGGIAMNIHKSLNFKSLRDLDIKHKKCRVFIDRISMKKTFCQQSDHQMVILKLLIIF